MTHLFGVKHCIYARCVMNGSNHIEEAESRPFVVCPVCLRKVHDSMRSVRRQNQHATQSMMREKSQASRCHAQVGVDLAAREKALSAFFTEHGMGDDAAESAKRLEVMASCGLA